MRTLEESLSKGDSTTAIRIAHSLKGAAATLGATRLSAHAKSVEMLLRQDGKPHTETLAELTESVQHELMALAAVLPPPASRQATSLAVPATAALIDALAARLAAGDFSAAELYNANEAALAAALGPDGPAFAQAMSRFDFRAALQHLAAARGPG